MSHAESTTLIRLLSLHYSSAQRVGPVLETRLAMPTPHVRMLPATTAIVRPLMTSALQALQHAREILQIPQMIVPRSQFSTPTPISLLEVPQTLVEMAQVQRMSPVMLGTVGTEQR